MLQVQTEIKFFFKDVLYHTAVQKPVSFISSNYCLAEVILSTAKYTPGASVNRTNVRFTSDRIGNAMSSKNYVRIPLQQIVFMVIRYAASM